MDRETAAFRILALEGGGSLAMNYLPILSHIEGAHFGGACLRDTGAFRMVMGTSTGAIVAAAIAAGAPAGAITDMYRAELRAIFRKSRWWNRPLFYLFDSERLHEVLRRRFREYTGGRDITWAELAHELQGRLELVVTLWKESSSEIKFLSTDLDNDHPYHERALHGAPVADIITACCSAPYYFSPRAFYQSRPGVRDYLGTFCDGGVTGLNNPGVLGISLAWRKALLSPRPPCAPDLRSGAHELQLVSMGTGYRNVIVSPDRRARWWVKDTVEHTVSDLMTASASLMHQFHGAFGAMLTFTKYLRTDQPIEADAGLDETDPERLARYENNFRTGKVTYYLGAVTGTERALTPQRGQLTPDVLGTILSSALGIPPRVGAAAPPVPLFENANRESGAPAPVCSEEVRARFRRRFLYSSIALSFIPLTAIVTVLLVITYRQWRDVSDKNVTISRQVEELSDQNRLINRQRAEIDKEANDLVGDQISTYEVPLTKLAWFLVPPVGANAAPFHDKQENVRRCREYVAFLDSSFRVPASGIESGKRLSESARNLRARLLEWADANATAPSAPPQGLVDQAVDLAGRISRQGNVTKGKSRNDKEFQRLLISGPLPRSDRVFVANRLRAYGETRSVVAALLNATSLNEPGALQAYQTFWELYWGGLLLFESKSVEWMMVTLGGHVGPGLTGWARTGKKPERFSASANWNRENVGRLVQEFIASDDDRVVLPEHFSARDFLVYLDYQIDIMKRLPEE